MSVMTSVMYAAAFFAILGVILECCCRRRLKQLRHPEHIIALHMVDNTPYPLVTPYPTLPLQSAGGSDLVAPAAPGPPAPGAPAPTGPPAHNHTHTDNNVFFSQYVATGAKTGIVETPPPTYEQVMSADRPPRPPRPQPG